MQLSRQVIYVVLGDRGLLKAGRTVHPLERRATLGGEFKKMGERVVHFEFSRLVFDGHAAETAFLATLSARHPQVKGREWFRIDSKRLPAIIKAMHETADYIRKTEDAQTPPKKVSRLVKSHRESQENYIEQYRGRLDAARKKWRKDAATVFAWMVRSLETK